MLYNDAGELAIDTSLAQENNVVGLPLKVALRLLKKPSVIVSPYLNKLFVVIVGVDVILERWRVLLFLLLWRALVFFSNNYLFSFFIIY